jgi:pyrroloquinoline quinone biosynthesis protein D
METEKEVFRRRPGLAWREEKEARREVLAALEKGGDVVDEGTLILVDSGQIFELNLLGADIWKLCDGERTVGEVVDDLLDRYDVERDELDEDVRAFLLQMEEKGWMEQV